MTHRSRDEITESEVSRCPVRIGQIATVGRRGAKDQFTRSSPDATGHHFGAPGGTIARESRQPRAGLRSGLVLIGIVTQDVLVSFPSFRVAEFFVALAHLEQSFCCQSTIPSVFLNNALVELDGFFQLAFHQLLVVGCLHQQFRLVIFLGDGE